jgi:uncharacterized phage protein (TIGR01671 family)
MREIAFRGKRKNNGEWMYGGLVDLFVRYDSRITEDHGIGNTNFWRVIPKTIGQYTGIKDKNGVKIFEGDIIQLNIGYWQFSGHDDLETFLMGEIVYLPEVMSFGMRGVKDETWLSYEGEVDTIPFPSFNFDNSDIDVVGNIHDNPEFLEVTEVNTEES